MPHADICSLDYAKNIKQCGWGSVQLIAELDTLTFNDELWVAAPFLAVEMIMGYMVKNEDSQKVITLTLTACKCSGLSKSSGTSASTNSVLTPLISLILYFSSSRACSPVAIVTGKQIGRAHV